MYYYVYIFLHGVKLHFSIAEFLPILRFNHDEASCLSVCAYFPGYSKYCQSFKYCKQLCLSSSFFELHNISAGHCTLFLHNMQWINIVNGFLVCTVQVNFNGSIMMGNHQIILLPLLSSQFNDCVYSGLNHKVSLQFILILCIDSWYSI